MTGKDTSSSPPSGRNHFVLAELGRVTGELLHDIVGTMGALSAHIELAQADAAAGHPVEPGLERIRADYEHLRTMVRDILEELRGRVRTPRTSSSRPPPYRRRLNGSCWAPPRSMSAARSRAHPDARVMGRASFFARSVANLLRNAARHARQEVRLKWATGETCSGLPWRTTATGSRLSWPRRSFSPSSTVGTAAPGSGSRSCTGPRNGWVERCDCCRTARWAAPASRSRFL